MQNLNGAIMEASYNFMMTFMIHDDADNRYDFVSDEANV